MRCIESSFLLYFIPNLLITRVNVIPFLLWRHNPGVIGAGSYPNGRRCSLSAVCAIIPYCNSPYIPLSTLTYIKPLVCLSMRFYSSINS